MNQDPQQTPTPTSVPTSAIPTPEPTPVQQPAVVPQAAPAPVVQSGSKGFAIAALIVGGVGFILGMIPFAGVFLAFPALIVGLVLGIIALVKRKPGKKLALASVIISAVGLVAAPLFFIVLVGLAAQDGIQERANQNLQDAIEREREPENLFN